MVEWSINNTEGILSAILSRNGPELIFQNYIFFLNKLKQKQYLYEMILHIQ